MSNWKNIGKQVQVVRAAGEGDGLGRFRWNNGLKVGRNGSAGCWYAKSESFHSLPPHWQASSLYGEDGYEAVRINMIPLLKRSQPFSVVDGMATWHTEWRPNMGMKMYTEVLCLIEGYNQPLVMTGKGWAASRITHYKRGCFAEQHEYVTSVASKLAGMTLQPWAFWHSIGGAYDKKHEPMFVEVGSGTQKTHLHDITLGIAQQATEQEIDALYVGDALYAQATDIYNEYMTAEWHKQKRKSADAPASASAAAEDDDEELAF